MRHARAWSLVPAAACAGAHLFGAESAEYSRPFHPVKALVPPRLDFPGRAGRGGDPLSEFLHRIEAIGSRRLPFAWLASAVRSAVSVYPYHASTQCRGDTRSAVNAPNESQHVRKAHCSGTQIARGYPARSLVQQCIHLNALCGSFSMGMASTEASGSFKRSRTRTSNHSSARHDASRAFLPSLREPILFSVIRRSRGFAGAILDLARTERLEAPRTR